MENIIFDDEIESVLLNSIYQDDITYICKFHVISFLRNNQKNYLLNEINKESISNAKNIFEKREYISIFVSCKRLKCIKKFNKKCQ